MGPLPAQQAELRPFEPTRRGMHEDMASASALGSSYLIAARRTALGRPGGLHRSRRLEDLTAPIVLAALQDAQLDARTVEEIILGNTTAGGNPARLVGLAAGLRESVPALTVDRQCASGLDAILFAMRAVAMGEADVIVAGGAESISTAPWRIAKPKSLFQTPRFIGLESDDRETADTS
jgi:acetyl-CoA C-acetyltransferase